MKFATRIKFATDHMMMNLLQLFGNILLCIFALLLIAVLLLMNEANRNLRLQLDRTFRDGSTAIGSIGQMGLYLGNDKEFETVFSSMESFNAIGTWGIHGATNECMQIFKEIQGEHTVLDGWQPEELEVFIISENAWDLFALDLYAGEEPGEYDLTKYTPIYVGYQYRDFAEVGTVLEADSNVTYVVAGILKPGVMLPTKNLDELYNSMITAAYSMDYEIVEVIPDWLEDPSYFSIKDGYSFEEVQEQIQQKAKEQGWSVTVASLDAELSSVEDSLKPVNRYMLQIILVVGLTVCMIFTCYQTISVIVRKSEYGILYANGATTRDLLSITLIENMLKMLISFLILIPVFMLLARYLFVLNRGDWVALQWIIRERVLWKVLLTGIGMALISSVLPICTLIHESPVSLIGGNRT